VPAVNVILDSLGVAEEASLAWEGAEEPQPIDVMAYKPDYVFGSGDVVRISIFELLQEGALFADSYIVTETGRISVPEVGVVEVAGLTESQLEEELKQILEPSLLKEPSVTVTLLSSEQRTFSIWGHAVPRPGRYTIPRYDFRLTDALATAGGVSQFNVSSIYVSRSVTGEEVNLLPTKAEAVKLERPEGELMVPSEGMLKTITPRVGRQLSEDKIDTTGMDYGKLTPLLAEEVKALKMELDEQTKQQAEKDGIIERLREENRALAKRLAAIESLAEQLAQERRELSLVITSVELGTNEELAEVALPELLEVDPNVEKSVLEPQPSADDEGAKTKDEDVNETSGELAERKMVGEDEADRIEWIFQDGRWVPVQVGRPEPTEPVIRVEPEKAAEPPKERAPAGFGWEEIGGGGVQTRVIEIPADELRAGNPRYNIVIKPADSIHVPVDMIGEFCIMGNVNRQGYINLTGRPMTLKMAIAAAGGLGPLAWPKRCEVVRRLAKDKEETVMVDLDRIALGEQPDFFIKPDDLINVGTHPTSRWRAVLRNAFRATYGFGFIYDRNFAAEYFEPRRQIDLKEAIKIF